MMMSVGVIGIERADSWLLDALPEPGQSDMVVAGCWSPPLNETGGCNDLGYGTGHHHRALTRGNGKNAALSASQACRLELCPFRSNKGRMDPGGERNVPTR
jgi:hypothetical protein